MKVVNIATYGGRAAAAARGVRYVGRPTPLGNLWSHKIGTLAKYLVDTREAAIAAYRAWLFERLKAADPEVVRELESIPEDAVLGCWCKPLACHADVIAAAWQWWFKKGGRETYGSHTEGPGPAVPGH